jgi:coproporphyrinogen III oxidase-like Fe-S oxidoreductase
MKSELRNIRQTFFSTVLTEVIDKTIYQQLQLENVSKDFQYPLPTAGKKYVLYAHIPFCESLCPYCSFNRFIFNESKARQYFNNLRHEMKMLADLGYDFVTMYIGGGTPTILIDELTKTIDYAKSIFSIKEVSSETNPNHLTKDILSQLKGRVDRLSVGVQSFNDNLLMEMSRYDKFGSGEEILEIIKNAVGILPSINVDMIFNLPNQTEEMLRKDLECIKKSGADQVTFYPLMSAPSVKKAMDRTLGKINRNREVSYYQLIIDELEGYYESDSAWTFSRTNQTLIDEYIVEYEEYVGTGSGAFSYLDGKLFVNTFSLNQYDKLINKKISPVFAEKSFSKHDQMRYRMMMELFDLSLDKTKFKKDFGVSVDLGLLPEMLFLRFAGAFSNRGVEPNKITVSKNNQYLMIVMMREFFANVNILRDQARFALPADERLMCVVNDKLYHNEFI